jgi:hypothetical protein
VVLDEVWCGQGPAVVSVAGLPIMMRIIIASALIIPVALVVARSLRNRKRRRLDLGVVSDHWMAQQRGRESPGE